jgi:hypothetical protein
MHAFSMRSGNGHAALSSFYPVGGIRSTRLGVYAAPFRPIDETRQIRKAADWGGVCPRKRLGDRGGVIHPSAAFCGVSDARRLLRHLHPRLHNAGARGRFRVRSRLVAETISGLSGGRENSTCLPFCNRMPSALRCGARWHAIARRLRPWRSWELTHQRPPGDAPQRI